MTYQLKHYWRTIQRHKDQQRQAEAQARVAEVLAQQDAARRAKIKRSLSVGVAYGRSTNRTS